SLQSSGGNQGSLNSNDIEPRLSFHYGLPSGATILASHDHPSFCLAVSTRDGRIKLFGKDNTQALLRSPDVVPTKFLKFSQNGSTLVLLHVNSNNHIEVWDVEKRLLSHIHVFGGDITSFMLLRHTPFMYVGDSTGNITVLKLGSESFHISRMKYTIPLSAASQGPSVAVVSILPVPIAETKRLLIVYQDGLIILWDIRESRTIFTTGSSWLPSQNQEAKKATCACWACPHGSKVVVGYNNGDIFIWSIPVSSNNYNSPSSKLNLGYKLDKVAIASLKWIYADGKASRLYIMGAASEIDTSNNSLQVVLLNENSETRTIKLVPHLPESCIGMDIVSTSEKGNIKQVSFLLLGRSGHMYSYDDGLIEKYLLQSQSKGSPSFPKEVMAKMPYVDSTISAAKFITKHPSLLNSPDEDYTVLARNVPSVLPFEGKDGTNMNSGHKFSGFAKIKNVYITGHKDGAINFWDVSCPLPVPILSLKQQTEDDFSLSGVPVTALYWDDESRLLISGDQNGTVRIFKFKPEPYASENSFMSFQGSSRKGNSHVIQSLKHLKIMGSILCISPIHGSGRVAVGSDQGYVSVIDIDGPTLLYQHQITTELSAGIISLKFETCNLHGFEKNALVVATRDSSVLALDYDTGNMLSTETVHPKKPSRALYMEILDGQSVRDLNNQETIVKDASKQPSVLICSEKAVYVYSLNHVAQGVKKVHYKKKFNGASCLWASTFSDASEVGLVLLLSSGKLEIRSLPELSLIRESSIAEFAYSAQTIETSICCSQDGEIFLVNMNELLIHLIKNDRSNFRLIDSFSKVYKYDPMSSSQEGSAATAQKEKKKGIFSSLGKSKSKQVPDQIETEDSKESIEEVGVIFSTANFVCDDEGRRVIHCLFLVLLKSVLLMLYEDDIEIEDPVEKHKDQNILTSLNKQKLVMASKLQAFKGK
ncbi:Syntaxin-binding protein 5, partial [Linum perenne]